MAKKEKTPVGKTKEVGFQVGARKTFPVSFEKARDFLFSKQGMKIWLGEVNIDGLEEGKEFRTKDGGQGKITVFKPESHIRLKWKPKEWENNSTLQVRIIAKKDKTIISFHQDHLSGTKQREEMKEHWNEVLGEFQKLNM